MKDIKSNNLNRSVVRARNRELINLWKREATNPKRNRQERGLLWQKVAIIQSLEACRAEPFTEKEALAHLMIDGRKWMKLRPWNHTWVRKSSGWSSIMDLYFKEPWLPKLGDYLEMRRLLTLVGDVAAVYRGMLGNDFLIKNWTEELLWDEMSVKYRRLFVRNLFWRGKGAQRILEFNGDNWVNDYRELMRHHPVMKEFLKNIESIQKLIRLWGTDEWAAERTQDFPWDLVTGFSANWLEYRAYQRTSKPMLVSRLIAFIINHFGRNKTKVYSEVMLDPQHFIALRFETPGNLSILTGKSDVKNNMHSHKIDRRALAKKFGKVGGVKNWRKTFFQALDQTLAQKK